MKTPSVFICPQCKKITDEQVMICDECMMRGEPEKKVEHFGMGVTSGVRGGQTVENAAPPQPGCCGPAKDRLAILKNILKASAMAHMHLARLYRELANDFPGERQDLLDAAVYQDSLYEQSLKATLPNALAVGDDEVLQK